MKKVLVLSNMYPSEKAKSFGIFVKNQVEGLRKKGLEVDVVAIKDARMGMKYALPKYMVWLLSGLLKLLTKGRSYEIVHAHYVFPTGMLGLLFKRLLKTRLIVTAHGGDIDRMARKNDRLFKWTKKILQEADHVIAVGDQLKDDMVQDFDLPESKVTVLNMGVNRQVFQPMDKRLAIQELGLAPEKEHVLFIGNIIQAKGVEELLHAFQAVTQERPQACLHVIGLPKEPSFAERMKGLAHEIGEEKVQFYPPIVQKELIVWMNAASCFILPSYIEGFGLVALEAMSCRTPVIATAVGGLKVLLDEERGILVPPKDADALKKAMLDVLSHPEAYLEMVDRAEALADHYSEEHVLDTLCEIYQNKVRDYHVN